MLILAWIFAIVGAGWAYVIMLGSAMKTVPSMSLFDMLMGMPLPLVAALIAGWRLFGNTPPPEAGRPWISAGLPFLLAVGTFILLVLSYFGQPGGPR